MRWAVAALTSTVLAVVPALSADASRHLVAGPRAQIDEPIEVLALEGVIRTIMRDGDVALTEGAELLVADVQGVLLPLEPSWRDSLADRQPVTVSIEAPDGFTVADALASAGGAVLDGAARVVSVEAAGPAPTIRALADPNGTHTITVLPIYWAEGDPWVTTIPSLVDGLSGSLAVWSTASGGRVQVNVTALDPVRIGGAPTCDPLVQYNAAMHAHRLPTPTTPLEHVAVVFPRAGLDCPRDTAATLAGDQLWPGTTVAHGFGHNLGLGHVGTAYCPGTDAPNTIPVGPGCNHHDGNEFEIMGQPSSAAELNPAFAELLGWSEPPIARTDVVNDVTLKPVRQGTGTPAVKIPLGGGRFAYARTHYPPDVIIGRIRWVGNAPRYEDTGRLLPGPPMLLEDSVFAVRTSGSASAYLRLTPRLLDTIAPTAPVITAPADGVLLRSYVTTVTVSWSAGTDEGLGLAGYWVYVDGEIAGYTEGFATSVQWVGIPPGSQRSTIVVEAVDAAGNSTASDPVVIRREGPPPAATDLSAVVGYASAHVTWERTETNPPLTLQSVSIYPRPPGWVDSSYAVGTAARSFERGAWGPGHYTLTVRGSNGLYPDSLASITFDVMPPTVTATATTADGHAPVTVSWTLGETTASPPASFRIDVDGAPRATAPGEARSSDVWMSPGEHQITVTAIDQWGDTVTSEQITASVAPDEPTHSVEVDGTVRTLVHDGSPSVSDQLIVDVGGVLLHIPDADVVGLSDGQPVTVALVAPQSMTGTAAALAAGLPGGAAVAHVASVTASGPPAVVAVPSDGLHTVTVLPVAWRAQAVGEDRTAVAAEVARTTWGSASGGLLTLSPSLRTVARLTGPTSCDPLAQYNAALVAHGVPPGLGAREHIVVHINHTCGWRTLAVLGGHQLWSSWTESASGGSWTNAFGHNLGLGHASVGGCAAGGVAEPPSVSCWTARPLYDAGELMASAGGEVSGAMASRLGWVQTWSPSPASEVTGQLRTGEAGTQEHPLVVPLDGGRSLVVEAGAAAEIQLRLLDTSSAAVTTQRLPSPSGRADLAPGEVYDVQGSPYVVSALEPTASGVPRVRVVPRSIDTTSPTAPVITAPTTWGVTPETTVTWEPSSDTGSGVAGYQVHVDGVLRAIVAGDRATATVPMSGGTQSLTLTAVDAAGNTASSNVTVSIGYLPYPRPTLTQVDATTIGVSWSVWREDLPHVPTTGYSIDVSPGNTHVDVPPDTRSLSLPDLDLHTLYTVTVVAHTPIGDVATSRWLRLTAPDSWLTLISPAPDATSPTRITWDVGPGLSPYLTHCALTVDGQVLRFVSPSTREALLAVDAGLRAVAVRCYLANGSEGATATTLTTVRHEDVIPPFGDVPSTHPFSSQITWMFNRGITTGYSDGTYRPGGSINRDAMAAFLFRYAGADIEGYEAPAEPIFDDVPTSHPFYREISWMAETGISTGYADGTYRPNAPVSRDAMAAFLYRFAGGPAPANPRPASFSDVPASHPFFTQITWLASAGITTGYPGGTYRPTQAISRDAMAAFLARMDAQWPRVPFQDAAPAPVCGVTACTTAI